MSAFCGAILKRACACFPQVAVIVTPSDQNAAREARQPAKRGRKPKAKASPAKRASPKTKAKAKAKTKAKGKPAAKAATPKPKAKPRAKSSPKSRASATRDPVEEADEDVAEVASDAEAKVAPSGRGSGRGRAKGGRGSRGRGRGGRGNVAPAPGVPDRGVLGCPRCRWAARGCLTCKDPSYVPRALRGKPAAPDAE